MLTTLEKLKDSLRTSANRTHRPTYGGPALDVATSNREAPEPSRQSLWSAIKRLFGRKVVPVEPGLARKAEALVAKGFTAEEISHLLSTESAGTQEALLRRELANPEELSQAHIHQPFM